MYNLIKVEFFFIIYFNKLFIIFHNYKERAIKLKLVGKLF
jgi:hypothetical protein